MPVVNGVEASFGSDPADPASVPTGDPTAAPEPAAQPATPLIVPVQATGCGCAASPSAPSSAALLVIAWLVRRRGAARLLRRPERDILPT